MEVIKLRVDSRGQLYGTEKIAREELLQKLSTFLDHSSIVKFLLKIGVDIYAYPEEWDAYQILTEIIDTESMYVEESQ